MPKATRHQRKVEWEKKTVSKMVVIFCKGNHRGVSAPCEDCRELIAYAHARIDHCPYLETKTFCSACQVHCYKPDMQQAIREAMRYAGPRMLFHDPVGAIRHLIQGRPHKRRGEKRKRRS